MRATISWGKDASYYFENMATTDESGRTRGGSEYYLSSVDAGDPPGTWWGPGAAMFGLTGEVSREAMENLFTKRQDPRNPGQLVGHTPRKYRTVQQHYDAAVAAEPWATPERQAELWAEAVERARSARATVDVTFNVPKSVSVARASSVRNAQLAAGRGDHAAAGEYRRQVAVIDRLIKDSAEAGLEYLRHHAAWGRVGHHGGRDKDSGRWIPAGQWVGTSFLQHTNREGDPHSHVHGVLWNDQLRADGKWGALDGAALANFLAGAEAVAARRLITGSRAELGWSWRRHDNGYDFEVAGVNQDTIGVFSARTRALVAEAQRQLAAYEAERGAPASNTTRYAIAHNAAKATRAAKTKVGPCEREQTDRWDAKLLTDRLEQVATDVAAAGAQPQTPQFWSEREVVERAVARLATFKGGSWRAADAVQAVNIELPLDLDIPADQVEELLARLGGLVWAASARMHPDDEGFSNENVLRRQPGAERRTSQTILDQQRQLRAAAVLYGAQAVTAVQAEALLAQLEGRTLSAEQAAVVTGILTSGAQMEVLRAAAGTGKSYVLGSLKEAWTASGGRVFGTAPSEAATVLLRRDGILAQNTDNFLARGPVLRPGDLVMLDEAGMASAEHIAEIQRRCEAAGAKLLLAGDDRQLRPVKGASVLGDLADRARTSDLREVRRFAAQWEKEASLRLREGDTSVIARYAAHGRLVDGGTREQTEAGAVRAYVADVLAGRDPVLVAQSNETAARLSSAVRAHLVGLGRVGQYGVPVTYDNFASLGDLVEMRMNAPQLKGYLGNEAHPINRHNHQVIGVRDDGGLITRHLDTGVELTLPADYVREHVALAYGRTAHSVQGGTFGVSHLVGDAHTSLVSAYVGLSRGTRDNVAHLVTQDTGHVEAETGETHAAERLDPRAVMAQILRNDDDPIGAMSELGYVEYQHELARSLQHQLDLLDDLVGEHAEARTGRVLDQLATDGALSAAQRAALGSNPQRMVDLTRLLRDAEVAGHDPNQVLATAVTQRDFAGVADLGLIIQGRIRANLHGQLAPQLHSTVDLVPREMRGDPRITRLVETADARRAELAARVAETQPEWAIQHVGPVPDDPFERARWDERVGWVAGWRELVDHDDPVVPLGAPPRYDNHTHTTVWRVAHEALDPGSGTVEAELSVEELQHRAHEWARAQHDAPRYVDDELAEAYHQVRDAREREAFATTRAALADERTARLWLEAEARHAWDAAQVTQIRIGELEQQSQVRGAWLLDHAEQQAQAQMAYQEAARRGLELMAEPADVGSPAAAEDVAVPDQRVTELAQWDVDEQQQQRTATQNRGRDDTDELVMA
ncbi:MAG: relaxase domain-containing protein [Streptosporangiaceae bacterium]|nr:relaxase domain-containing protein [Streptosporangiaceae bacterium]